MFYFKCAVWSCSSAIFKQVLLVRVIVLAQGLARVLAVDLSVQLKVVRRRLHLGLFLLILPVGLLVVVVFVCLPCSPGLSSPPPLLFTVVVLVLVVAGVVLVPTGTCEL